ncbi:MAG TPA: glycosyltransferase family 4 protein [Syntrophorhabdus sp.]|nr:glycosyltransferase family 4 protein [Syntrophorhabdus sp.]
MRLQRWLILRMSGQVVVSVYSRTEGDPPHIFETVTTSLSKAEIKRALDSMNNSTHEDCRLLWVGRFTPNKNVSALFDTLLAVLRVFPNASLHLVGEGPGMKMAREEVERRGITEKIIFHGSQSWEILCSYYSAARLLLLPSFSEGFPKVVLEAALFGTPSIVFSVGALPKIVQDRGVAVKPPGDSAAFSRATIEILQDRKRWERLSNSARRWAEQICIESVVDGYLDLIEKAWGVRID